MRKTAIHFGSMLVLTGIAWLCGGRAVADELSGREFPAGISSQHPAAQPWRLVAHQLEQIRAAIDDYTCILVKRERIEGRLQQYQYISCKVRRRIERDGEIVRPFAVNMRYLAPGHLRGRVVLFIEGQNDNRMLVQRGGSVLGRVTLKVSPESPLARRESLLPITEIGFENMAMSLLRLLEEEMRLDPGGDNTQVRFFKNARLNERLCTRIQVTHARPQEGFVFHIAEVFLDEQLRLPLRVATYDWSDGSSQPPSLLGEFNYTQLELNVGLGDADFQ